MRLYTYINEARKYEDLEPEEILTRLSAKCKQMVNVYSKSHPDVLWRGVGVFSKPKFIETEARLKDRRPKDTPTELHSHINHMLNKKFGWPARNGLFATGRKSDALVYGYPYVVFPFDGFKFVYNFFVDDLTGALLEDFTRSELLTMTDEVKDWVQEVYIDECTNKNLKQGIRKGVEVSFNAKGFYMVGDLTWGELML
jgi:hypothetical protein